MKKLFIILSIFFIALNSCKNKPKDVDFDSFTFSKEHATIVNRVTMGKISKDEIIRIYFVDDIVDDSKINEEINSQYISFEPNISGKIYWETKRVLAFKPNNSLPYWQTYNAKLLLKNIDKTFNERNISDLLFAFQIVGVEITDFEADFILKDNNNPVKLLYKGSISFSEIVPFEVLNKAVSLKQGNSTIKILWNNENDANTYSFVSEDIIRDDKEKAYIFSVNNKDIALENAYETHFNLSPLSDMQVTSIDVDVNGKSPKIKLIFSDDFMLEQNIDGMIKINKDVSFKAQRMGKQLVLDGDFLFGTDYEVTIAKGIKSKWATQNNSDLKYTISVPNLAPQIEFASDGIYLPNNNNYKLQFYSTNLQRVHLEIKKVYSKNINEFVRNEQLNSANTRKTAFNNNYINRVGLILHNETFEISATKNQWMLNEIDLSKLLKSDTDNSVYLIRLNFNPRDMLVDVEDDTYAYIESNGQIYKPLFISNIGITCKFCNDGYMVFANDITTGKPLKGVSLELKKYYDYGNTTRTTAITDSEGFGLLNSKSGNYGSYIEAEYNGQRTIVKFNEMEWNISGFDVGGVASYEDYIKAFSYTERGVYRPGDPINISVIVRDNSPSGFRDNQVVKMTLYNPEGKKIYEQTSKSSKEGFLNFRFETKQSDPTGTWKANFNIAHRGFYHDIQIETVVPYKLKLKLDSPLKKILHNHKQYEINLKSDYLFGNPAINHEAEVSILVIESQKKFGKYSNFTFSNPTKEFNYINRTIYKGTTGTGELVIKENVPSFANVPSALNMKVTAKVLEKGGRPNISWFNLPIEPYSHYVGLEVPKYGYVATGKDLEIPVILVDTEGNPQSGKSLTYRIYRNSTYWWWQYDRRKNLRFKTDNSTSLLAEGKIMSGSKHAIIKYLPIESGNYYIEVESAEEGGHSAGLFFSAYPYGGVAGGDKNAGMLALRSDKDKYFTGENAKIQFPSPKEGTILVTVEKQNKILSKQWYYPSEEGDMSISIPITEEMVPNAYVSVSLIQPHKSTKNDRPIRMFGILPINVENKNTKHDFVISTPSFFRPETECKIDIQTQDMKKTQFTVAIVDEGLLDITQFQTPNPWPYFFAKKALNVRTYDVYSHVINANKDDVFRTFSIGGDKDYRESQMSDNKVKRFEPVCIFRGPVETDENGKAEIKFDMPNYIGSVRIMVIGARENSYASSQKAVPVKSELMVLPTLPRVLGPNEKIKIPVTVFAMEDNIGDVTVSIKTSNNLNVIGNKSKTISFDTKSDKDVYFELSTPSAVGEANVKIEVKSAKYSANNKTDIMVRASSARIYDSKQFSVKKGTPESVALPKIGIDGSNRASINISAFNIADFGHRLEWLINYPYGCIEQTTSAIFPQLYIKRFVDYSEAQSKKIDENINAGIERLQQFQLFSGGFSYWPGGNEVSSWGTLYAGHFLVEAKKLGYHVPQSLYENWMKYMHQASRSNMGENIERVYRCYILSLDNLAVSSEMNALRESNFNDLRNVEKWLLAAAFYLSGQTTVAESISANLSTRVDPYKEFSRTYGSTYRDVAMIMDACFAMGKIDVVERLSKELSKEIASNSWHSTQTLGYSLLTLGKYINSIVGNQEKIEIVGYVQLPNGDKIDFNTSKSVKIPIKTGFGSNINVVLDNSTTINSAFVSLNWDGVPLVSTTTNEENNLRLSVQWFSDEGNEINISRLKQGTSFWGHFTVENISEINNIEELALVQVLPSGWEIENIRLLDQGIPYWLQDLMINKEKYVDIRDDRIMWFFDIENNKYSETETIYRRDFIVKLNAVTIGEFYLPATITEAMYDNEFNASISGQKVIVE